jgi:ATP-dependent DNA helicase RecG
MSELLVLAERVRNAIALGESHFREFKSALQGPPGNKRPRPWAAVSADIAEALVAFANADGGDLLVGVEDDGTVTGIPHADDDIKRMLSAAHTHSHPGQTLPVQLASRLQLEGREILFFSVLKGTTSIHQLADGRCVRRDGTSTVPESVDRILFDRRESQSRAYDTEFVDGAQLGDLDIALLRDTAEAYLHGIGPEKYLQQMGLAEYAAGGLRLRRAAMLLFASDISRWHPRCQVRVLKVAGDALGAGTDYNVVSDETAQGNVLELLISGWEKIRPFLAYKTEYGTDTRFEQRYIYPEGACREALVNAITHRDYTIHNAIEVFIFDDRMEIRSAGSLLSTLTIEQLTKLQGAHESRNSLIARVLREGGYVRELGEGMKRIFQLMEARELSAPKLSSSESTFSVSLHNRSVYSEQQLSWLDLFADVNLSRLQQRIVVAGIEGRELSPEDIYRAMNTRDRNTYDREVTVLRTKGLLKEIRTNPDATQIARASGRPKGSIPRFQVVTPNEARPIRNVRATAQILIVDIPKGVPAGAVESLMTTFGPIESIHVTKSKSSNPTRLGYVRYVSDDDAERVIAVGAADLMGRLVRFTKLNADVVPE